jgi:ketosteroid isomerase-like protein
MTSPDWGSCANAGAGPFALGPWLVAIQARTLSGVVKTPVALAFMAVACAGPSSEQRATPDDGNSVATIRTSYQRAYNAGDVARVVALYAPDATLTSADGVFKGTAAIAVWVKSGIDQGGRLEILEADETAVSGEVAYEAGHSRRLAKDEVHLGRYLIVMRHFKDGWRIIQHASLNAH